ncbi:MAG: helix-turn-helix domain-containing protein [Treponema sp.]|nr:helix-turn-helix domain-containing protein [Candidatus Treponema merdequi]
MRIYFLTRQPDVCQLLADKMAGTNVEIKIYPLLTKLFQNIFEFGVEPDILFLDFMYYQSTTFNPYSLLLKHNKMFPIVFYNHPFPLAENRKMFWKKQLQKTGYFSDLSAILPFLDIMQNALQNPEIYPYVSCIQEPKEYISDNLRYIEPIDSHEVEYYTSHFSNVITDFLVPEKKRKPFNHDENTLLETSDCIKKFHKRNHISNKLQIIFNKLYQNFDRHVSAKELCEYISRDDKPASSNSLRLTIHRLRNILANDSELNFDIISFNKGYILTTVPDCNKK